jgi:hypothetical protein
VPPDHRCPARTAKNALPRDNQLEVPREAVHHVPAAEELAENPAARQPAGAPEDGEGPVGGGPATEAHAPLEKDPIRGPSIANPRAISSGEECKKVCPVNRH